jgi:hypothetical protein
MCPHSTRASKIATYMRAKRRESAAQRKPACCAPCPAGRSKHRCSRTAAWGNESGRPVAVPDQSYRFTQATRDTPETAVALQDRGAAWPRALRELHRSNSGHGAQRSALPTRRSESGVTRLTRALRTLIARAHRICEPAAARLIRAEACAATSLQCCQLTHVHRGQALAQRARSGRRFC